MQVLNFLAILAFAGSIAALTLPTRSPTPSTWHAISENEHGTVYSSVSPQKRAQPNWHHFGENEHGIIYTNIASAKRDTLWHQIGKNNLGPVYSNVKPNVA